MSSDYHAKAAAEQERLAEQVRAIEHELRTSPDYQPYFAPYQPERVEAFIQQYARRKVQYQQQGAKRLERLEAEATEVRDQARQRLWDIQQKKLFDLQCRWRAGLVRLPGADVVQQFEYWGQHPLQCPFLPPITPEELALYREYVASPASPPDGGWADGGVRRHWHWQDYELWRSFYYEDELPGLPPDSHLLQQNDEEEEDEDWNDADDDDEDDWDDDDEDDKPYYPAWYRYYDERQGTGQLRHLPDVRGMRERFYLDLCSEDRWNTRRAEIAAAPAPAPAPTDSAAPAPEPAAVAEEPAAPIPEPVAAPAAEEPALAAAAPDSRLPWYEYDRDELFRMIVEQFDPTHQLLELRRAMREGQEQKFSLESDQSLFDFHDLANEHHLIVPIDAPAPDWRVALRQAAQEMRRRQLLAALPLEYEDYCQRLNLGLQPAAPPYEGVGNPTDDWRLNHIQHRREEVLRGRVLNGEPADFDF